MHRGGASGSDPVSLQTLLSPQAPYLLSLANVIIPDGGSVTCSVPVLALLKTSRYGFLEVFIVNL